MDYRNTVISFGNSKEASLYFDSVIPVNMAPESIFQEFDHKTGGIQEGKIDSTPYIRNLMPSHLLSNASFMARLLDLNLLTADLSLKLYTLRDSTRERKDVLKQFKGARWKEIEKRTTRTYFNLINDYGLVGLDGICGEDDVSDTENNLGDVAITLSALALIDVSKTSWIHLSEFREDKNAREKLRKLRLFVRENYSGKNKSYIEDDLHRRIYEYDEEVRRWGFETKNSTLTMLLKSKWLGATFSSSLISALFGALEISAITAITGTCVELGRVGLDISHKRFVHMNSLSDNPISYIKIARDRLNL